MPTHPQLEVRAGWVEFNCVQYRDATDEEILAQPCVQEARAAAERRIEAATDRLSDLYGDSHRVEQMARDAAGPETLEVLVERAVTMGRAAASACIRLEREREVPHHLRLALLNAQRAFERDDIGALATINEDIQGVMDAALSWGRRRAEQADRERDEARAALTESQRAFTVALEFAQKKVRQEALDEALEKLLALSNANADAANRAEEDEDSEAESALDAEGVGILHCLRAVKALRG